MPAVRQCQGQGAFGPRCAPLDAGERLALIDSARLREHVQASALFLAVAIKHLPKLHVIGSGPRKRYLYVAIDRASRMVHLAIKDEETETGATAFLSEVVAAFPFKATHVLTDRGSCFTADGFEAVCHRLGIDHRKTKPYTSQTHGMIERFNSRIGREVLIMSIGTHDALERLLPSYNLACNARRQRVLDGQSPNQVVQARLEAKPELVNPAYQPPGPCHRTRTKIAAQVTVYSSKDISHPDTDDDPYLATALADSMRKFDAGCVQSIAAHAVIDELLFQKAYQLSPCRELHKALLSTIS